MNISNFTTSMGSSIYAGPVAIFDIGEQQCMLGEGLSRYQPIAALKMWPYLGYIV